MKDPTPMNQLLRSAVLLLTLMMMACSSSVTDADVLNGSDGAAVTSDGTVAGNPENDGTVAGNPENDDGTVAGNPTSDTRQLTGVITVSPALDVAAEGDVGTVEVVAIGSDGSEVSQVVALGEEFDLTIRQDQTYELHLRRQGIQFASLRYGRESGFHHVAVALAEGETNLDLGNTIFFGNGEVFAAGLVEVPDADDGDFNLDGHMDSFQGLALPNTEECVIRYSSVYQGVRIPLNPGGSQVIFIRMTQEISEIDPSVFTITDINQNRIQATSSEDVPQDPLAVGLIFRGMLPGMIYNMNIPIGSIACDGQTGPSSDTTIKFTTMSAP